MRRSELLALRWLEVNLTRRTATLHVTKNGESCIVPLSSSAIETLVSMPRGICGAVSSITSYALAANLEKPAHLHSTPVSKAC